MSQLITISTASFTRPNDTTQYAINDVVGTSPATVLTFANCARVEGGSGILTQITHNKNSTTVAAATFRLFLWRVAPTAITDNAAHTLLFANRANRIGFWDLSAHVTSGSGSDSTAGLTSERNIPFQCAPGDRSLYGVLVATGAYTPVANEQHWLELQLIQG